MADIVQCVGCGKIRARFDNHVGSCIHCTNCSIASPCGICCQWPAENWQSCAARLERRKRARARVSRLQAEASDTPPEKMMKPSPKDASPSTEKVVASPPPLPLPPPLPTISSEAPQDVLTTILGHLSAVTASLDAQSARMDAFERSQATLRGEVVRCHASTPPHQVGGPFGCSSSAVQPGFSRPVTPRVDYSVRAKPPADSCHDTGVASSAPRSSPAGVVAESEACTGGRSASAAQPHETGTGHRSSQIPWTDWSSHRSPVTGRSPVRHRALTGHRPFTGRSPVTSRRPVTGRAPAGHRRPLLQP